MFINKKRKIITAVEKNNKMTIEVNGPTEEILDIIAEILPKLSYGTIDTDIINRYLRIKLQIPEKKDKMPADFIDKLIRDMQKEHF